MKIIHSSLSIYIIVVLFQHQVSGQGVSGFVQTRGTQFILNGTPFNFNGFNSYWMMIVASGATNQSSSVPSVLQQASQHGLTVGRTWAFSDGGAFPLQTSPGVYNEDMFKALDWVVSEAGKNGIRLIMSLVNNYPNFGGRTQYVQWAKEGGQSLNSDDDFYTNDVVKGYYKNHIMTVLTRNNTITGVVYKDDPAIFAWELINEPRCESDTSGKTLQAWIGEMASYVKSIDTNHLVEIGGEGFYGASMPDRKALNPYASLYGTDFVPNNQVPEIDFATIHAYPDSWLPGKSDKDQQTFMSNWTQAHIQDTAQLLKKPLVIGEFGKSLNGSSEAQRDALFWVAYDAVYYSAKAGGPLSGGLFWNLLGPGMDELRDGYEVIFPEEPSTGSVIDQQSQRISKLNY
ncbi:uncharacterized protein A4U43_C08F29700 [Asparagus officinalis]|uniref:mannan endo-1,4-beta-mannosidase 1-like n=1 Tax=Asparagus officinalis TaxID=4686 RepID=UPI00098E2020|nr:mannan endo-1,4-beta-mannosidase 1-like [Asparagus officinalis]ONK61418.1 uncharacterized protein A4U43_C08F29700 [Asparagus officinalis]